MKIFNNKPRMKKIIGLRNIVTTKDKWSYLLFYDMDNPSEGDIRGLINTLEDWSISYIIYKTKHGIHMIGLTPLDSSEWGEFFRVLQREVPEYYSGQTIRLSLKEGEKQSLVFYNLDYPYITNLLDIYKKKFFKELFLKGLTKPTNLLDGYHLVFEKYWSKKI